MALKVKFEAETGNDIATPGNIAQALVNIDGMDSQAILDIAAHLNIIGRSMRRTEVAENNETEE